MKRIDLAVFNVTVGPETVSIFWGSLPNGRLEKLQLWIWVKHQVQVFDIENSKREWKPCATHAKWLAELALEGHFKKNLSRIGDPGDPFQHLRNSSDPSKIGSTGSPAV